MERHKGKGDKERAVDASDNRNAELNTQNLLQRHRNQEEQQVADALDKSDGTQALWG